MILIKKIITFFLFLFSFCMNVYALENKILYKVNNEIITSIDLLNEVEYLTLINKNIKNLSQERIFEIGMNSILREKIKKIELKKYVSSFEVDENFYNLIQDNFLKKINFETINELEKYLLDKNLNIKMIKQKLIEEALWNQLILSKYSKDIKVDKKKIREEILKNNFQKEFLLSEIVFDLDQNQSLEEKLNQIKSEISSSSFSNAALTYSNSDTSKNGGKLGWIKLNSLNPKIKKILSKIKKKSITEPIVIPGGFLILKIEDIREAEVLNNIDREVEIVVNEIANKQLNQFSIIFFNKIEKEVKIDEF